MAYLAIKSSEISFLNDYELLLLESTIHNIEHRNCRAKFNDMVERSGMSYESAMNSMNMLHSCSSIKEQALIKTNSFELFTCSCNFMTPSINELIRLYYLMKKGMLPFSGGYFEQPYKFFQIMEIIEEYCHKKEEQAHKELQSKSKRKR